MARILAIIIVIIAVGIGVWWFMSKPGETLLAPEPEETQIEAPAGDAATETTLPAEDFDAEAILRQIEESDLASAQKQSLSALVEAAVEDASLRKSVLEQVQAALQ